MILRTYTELITLPTFEERYEYLRLSGKVGEDTFGSDRYLNQKFYQTDPEWLAVRDFVITRDLGRDLAMPGREISEYDIVTVHHMNPIRAEDIIYRTDFLLDPEYLITTIDRTHKAIHYGSKLLLYSEPVERTQYDTCPWRR